MSRNTPCFAHAVRSPLSGGVMPQSDCSSVNRLRSDGGSFTPGFTEKAMYCLSATAEREGVEYIAVIMHADTIDKRNNDAKVLLSYGFANYRLMPLRSPDVLPPVRVTLGSADSVQPVYDGAEAALVPKNGIGEVSYEIELPDTITAPVEKGQQIGTLRVVSGETELYTVKLLADSSVARASFGRTLLELVKSYVGLG